MFFSWLSHITPNSNWSSYNYNLFFFFETVVIIKRTKTKGQKSHKAPHYNRKQKLQETDLSTQKPTAKGKTKNYKSPHSSLSPDLLEPDLAKLSTRELEPLQFVQF